MTNEILINNRVNQVTGATDWLTFADAGFPDLPEVYTIVDLDANRATDGGGHYRNLYGIRLGKIPDPDTLRIFEYLADSNSDSFDSDTEAGAEYTRAASWPPGAGEFATSGNGDIVYFHASQNNVQVAVLPYQFRCTPLTLEKIKAFAQAAVSGSELDALVDAAVNAAVDAAVDALGIGAYPPRHISGLILSNNIITDPTNDIDIGAGSARDSTDAVNMDLAVAITKRLDAAWAVGTNQGGLDTGAIANTTYHVWLIKRSDTEVVDVLFSTSATSPTMPANYDYKQRIGAIVRSAGAILPFVHDGDTFRYVTPIADVAATNPGTSAVTRTLTLPTGITDGIAIVIHALESPAGTNTLGVLTALDETDTAPSNSFNDTGILSGNAGYGNISGTERRVKINTSAQIRSRVSGSSASVVDYITTIGWIERRVI